MKYIKYLTIVIVALAMLSFISNRKERKMKPADKAPWGHVQWVKEITYHAVEDSSGNISKGDIVSDTDYDRMEEIKSDMQRKIPSSEPPIQLWIYDGYGNEIQNDKFHANGMLYNGKVHIYDENGDVKEVIDSAIRNAMPPNIQIQQYIYKYDISGKILVQNKWDYNALNRDNSKFSREMNFYDSLGKLRETMNFERDTINPVSIIWKTYNEKGKVVETDERKREGNPPQMVPFEKNDFWYDSKGRLYDKATYHPQAGLVKDEKTTYDSSGKTITTYSYAPGRVLTGTVVKRIFKSTNTTQEDTYDGDGFLTEYTIAHDSAKHLMDKGVFHITYRKVMGADRRYHNSAPGDTVMVHHIINDNHFNTVVDDNFSNNGKPVSQKSYQYTYDDTGNWTAKIQFNNDRAVKITEREIGYFKE